jgi:hypothetical protein
MQPEPWKDARPEDPVGVWRHLLSGRRSRVCVVRDKVTMRSLPLPPPYNIRARLLIQHTISVVTMPADAFSALLTLESMWKVNVGMIKSGIVMCYNAADANHGVGGMSYGGEKKSGSPGP